VRVKIFQPQNPQDLGGTPAPLRDGTSGLPSADLNNPDRLQQLPSRPLATPELRAVCQRAGQPKG